jgi:hypothetical protein
VVLVDPRGDALLQVERERAVRDGLRAGGSRSALSKRGEPGGVRRAVGPADGDAALLAPVLQLLVDVRRARETADEDDLLRVDPHSEQTARNHANAYPRLVQTRAVCLVEPLLDVLQRFCEEVGDDRPVTGRLNICGRRNTWRLTRPV